MKKKKLSIYLFILVFANTSFAHENQRIEKLEQEIEELKAMMAIIVLSSSTKDKVKNSVNEKWLSKDNWRKLKTDMQPKDVRQILGEPEKINGGNISTWHYSNFGQVIFSDDRVYRWREPNF